ncbi:hypothetical protein D3C73_1079500 [compost metagenome]
MPLDEKTRLFTGEAPRLIDHRFADIRVRRPLAFENARKEPLIDALLIVGGSVQQNRRIRLNLDARGNGQQIVRATGGAHAANDHGPIAPGHEFGCPDRIRGVAAR